MKRLITTLLTILLFSSVCYSQYGWFPQAGVFWSYEQDLYFFDENNGFIAASLGLYHTTDGGENWQLNQDILNNVNKIVFVNNLLGYVLSNHRKIYKTTDGGNSWQQTYDFGPFESIWDIASSDGNNVYLISRPSDQVIYKSTDGGMSFDSIKFPHDTCGWYTRIYTLSSNTVIVSGPVLKVFKSTDGAHSWHPIFEIEDPWNIMLYPQNDGRIFLSVQSGDLWYSSNQGGSWNFVNHIPGDSTGVAHLRSLNFFGQLGYAIRKTGMGTTQRYFARTFDNGRSWFYSKMPVWDMEIIYFVNEDIGWSIGSDSKLYKTITGAATDTMVFFQKKNNINKYIDDFQAYYDSMAVFFPTFIPPNTKYKNSFSFESPQIIDIVVSIDTILHPQSSELELKLIHLGVTDTLAFGLTAESANFINTNFDDSAATSITSASPPYTGTFKPYKPLSQFYNLDVNGIWVLEIYDNTTGNTGVLKAWGLQIKFKDRILDVETESNTLPKSFQLSQNYPNPFNPSTTIKYSIPSLKTPLSGGSGLVTLKIYDILGREVETLVNKQQLPGNYEVTFNANGLPSGVYFYRLTAGNFYETKKLLLLK